MHCLLLMTSVASGDLSRLTHTYCLQILAKLPPKSEFRKSYKPHAAHVQFYMVKQKKNLWRRGYHYAWIPCFRVYFRSVLMFTVFYRIKCEFRELAKTYWYGFYRVNHASGPKQDPKMDPEMGPTNVRKIEEASPGLQKCTQTSKIRILDPMLCHFDVILISALTALGAYSASFFKRIRKFHKP